MQHVRRRTLIVIIAGTLACSCAKKAAPTRPALETLDVALSPTALVDRLRRMGGGHFHTTASFQVSARKPEPSDGSRPAAPGAVVTTTDLWMDKLGNFRLVETNDQDGGREIVRVGAEVGVALRYGKMIRRAAQDSETARFLAEAMGAPWAAWEVVRRQIQVQGASDGVFRFERGKQKAEWPAHLQSAEGLRKWRGTLEVTSLSGEAQVDRGQDLRAFTCKAAFTAVRDELPVDGTVEVAASFDQPGQVPTVEMPSSETLQVRQRTILEERALLNGLGASSSSGRRTGP
jgi:hypothetical protein